MSRGLGVRTALVAAFVWATAAPAVGQSAGPGTVTVDRPSWAAALARVPRPAAPLVGVAVALPHGSGLDPADRPGAGTVAAEAVVGAVETRLGLGDVEGRAEVRPDLTVLTFLVRPERIGDLMDALDDAAFGTGPDATAVESARRRRADVLRFELDSPVREVDVERRALLYGPGDSRNHPPGGTLEAVEALTASEVEGTRRAIFSVGDARVVVVGPVQADTLAAPPSSAATGTTSTGPAWSSPDRRVVVREVTNAWVSVAFPVPAALDRVAVLHLADRMARELSAVPPDPGLFNTAVEIVEMPEGEVLLVQAAVLPEAAQAFEDRILQLPARLAAERDPAFFRYHRGRFRAARLVDEAAPEAAATRMAVELLTRGEILDVDEAVWSLDADTAAAAAAALGPPRILVFGPDLAVGGRP